MGHDAGNPEHWELKESIGQDWEQTGNKTGNTGNISISHQPSDTAIRAGHLDAPGTAPSLAPADNARHESCRSASIAPAAC